MGATILSVTIAALWLHTAHYEFQLIIGVAAERETLRLITYIGESLILHYETANLCRNDVFRRVETACNTTASIYAIILT